MGAERLLDRLRDGVAIVLVHERREAIGSSFEASSIDPEDLFQLAAPPDRVGLEIPGPSAHPARTHRQRERVGALAKLAASLLRAVPGDPERVAEADDDEAGEQHQGETDVVLRAADAERVSWNDEEVVAGEKADDGRKERGAISGEPHRDRDCAVEGGKGKEGSEPRVEQPAKHDREHRRQEGDGIC